MSFPNLPESVRNQNSPPTGKSPTKTVDLAPTPKRPIGSSFPNLPKSCQPGSSSAAYPKSRIGNSFPVCPAAQPSLVRMCRQEPCHYRG